MDGTDNLVLALKAILAVKENFKMDYVIDFLRGNETETILVHKHDKLEEFGAGADVEVKMWNAVIHQGQLDGYIEKDVENYGLLKVTKLGKKFLKKPTEFLIVEDNDFEDYDDSMEQGGTGVADEMLYKMLLDQRKKEAAKHDLPPYVVFLDA